MVYHTGGVVVGVLLCSVEVGFRLLGTTEWTRVTLGRTPLPYNVVCVVIVKLSAY